MRKLSILMFVLLSSLTWGQSTSVTLQVTDADGQTWNNGTWHVALVTTPGYYPSNYVILGTTTPVPNQVQDGALSGSGGGTMTLTPQASISPVGSTWHFTVCSQATAPCYVQNVTISGASQTVTLAPPGIRISMPSTLPRVAAYTDTEIVSALPGNYYWNLVDNSLHYCSGAPCTWVVLAPAASSLTGTNNTWTGTNAFNSTITLTGSTNVAKLDGSNQPFTGAVTVSGTLTASGNTNLVKLDGSNQPFTGTISVPSLNGIRMTDQFASIQAAVTNAGTSGGVLRAPGTADTGGYTSPYNSPWVPLLRRKAIERVGSLTLGATSGSMGAGTYYLTIVAVDQDGGEGQALRNEQSIVLGASSGITATWPAVTNAQSYNLYIGTASGTYLQVYSVAGTSTTITVTPVAGPSGLTLTLVADATSKLKGDEYAFVVTAYVNGAWTVRDDTTIKFAQLSNAMTNAERVDATWNAVTGATNYRLCVSRGARRVLLDCVETASTSYSFKDETVLNWHPYQGNVDQVSSSALYVPALYVTSDTRVVSGGQFMTQPRGEGDAAYICDRASQSGQFCGLSIRTNTATKWLFGTRGVSNDKLTLNSVEASGTDILTIDGNAAAGAPLFSFYSAGADRTPLGINTDAGGTARLKSTNNGTAFWELDFIHGANKQFTIQSPTHTWLKFDDTALTATYGDSSAIAHTFVGTISASSQITSTLATGTAPFSITSTTPVANLTTVPTTYNHSGTQQTGTHLVQDSCTLGTDCAVTLTGAAVFTSSTSYTCICVDDGTIAACKVAQSSGSAFTITGTGTDSIRYVCVGN